VVDRRGHGRIPSPPSQLIDSGAEPVSLEVDTEGHEIGVDVTREMSMEKDWLAEGAAAQALKCC
jgi:hypothetical protein